MPLCIYVYGVYCICEYVHLDVLYCSSISVNLW